MLGWYNLARIMVKNLNICKYTSVSLCDAYGVNARFNLLFQEVCALKNSSPSSYILPIATSVALGGIKVGTGLTINSSTGVLSVATSGNTNHFSITSVDFESDGKTYINTALVFDNTSIFLNDVNRFIYRVQGEWTYVTGGGIQILIPGFDANVNSYNIEIFTK